MTGLLKLYPELSAAALRVKRHRELALWCELRAINCWGSGWLDFREAVRALTIDYGYRDRQARTILNRGEGTFWRLHKNAANGRCRRIEILALLQIAKRFEVPHLRRPVTVPIGEWLKSRRGWLYASFFKGRGSRMGKPISRATIEAVTGTDKRQQRRFERETGIRRTSNFAYHEPGVPMLASVEGKSRTWRIVRRLGNTYHSKAASAPLGVVKKVNRELRSLYSGEARHPRFFPSARAALRAPNRLDDSFVVIPTHARLVHGRREWQSTGGL